VMSNRRESSTSLEFLPRLLPGRDRQGAGASHAIHKYRWARSTC
jgi:hypothetical protein